MAEPGPPHYDAGFYSGQSERSLRSARAVVPIVMDLVAPRSVVDYGCGVGSWLLAFQEAGVTDLLGIDGDYVRRELLLVDPRHFRSHDLSAPEPAGRRFDLAVSLEVGEHLAPSVAPRLVEALVSSAPCVLFSAALPGQGGTNHVNEQWPGYWRALFERHQYDRLDPIRPRIWRNREVAWWYQQNLYLFCRADMIRDRPELAEEAALSAEAPFELLHTTVHAPLVSVRGAARNLWRAASRYIGRRTGRLR